MGLECAARIMMGAPKGLAARAAMVKYARRDLAMLAARAKELVKRFDETIPDDQLPGFIRNLRDSVWTVGVRRPAADTKYGDYGLWLSYEQLNALLDGCHDHCMVCTADKIGRMKCPLRRALDQIPNDVTDRAGDCPYYGGI